MRASTVHAAVRSVYLTEILPARESELRRPRRSSSGVRLAYTGPSGERQRAPSTPQQWGPPCLHRSLRRATAGTVHAAVGFVYLTEILSASESELRPRCSSSGVRLAYTDPSGERQRAPSTPRWGPSSLQGSVRRAKARSVHTCYQEGENSFFKNKKKQGDLNSLRSLLQNVPTEPLRHGASTTCCNALLNFCT